MTQNTPHWRPIAVFTTGDNISLTFEGKAPYSLRRPSSNEVRSKKFDELAIRVASAMKTGTREEWESIKAIFMPAVNITGILDTIIDSSQVADLVHKGGRWYYKGYMLKNYLVDKIEAIQAEANLMSTDVMDHPHIKSLSMFLNNLMKNPSSRAVTELYRFVEHTNLPVSDDGCLLAYKIIRRDYTDKHSGKMDNSPGKVVEMPRNMVDSEANRTCSKGLHFCSYNYATGGFNNRNSDRMVVIKISPEDVVSIPTDYNNEKGRCCKFTVLYEIPMEEILEKDVLGIAKQVS